MGPKVDRMSNLTINSNSDAMSLSVLKLRDDGSNWADYQLRIGRALGLKGLWGHILGTAIKPTPYTLLAGVPVIADGKTEAIEEQIEAKEAKFAEYKKREYLARDGLYRVIATKPSSNGNYAATASGKMSISEAHRKLRHLSYGAISHAVLKGYITGIELDSDSKKEFCEACAKAKAAREPFLKESKMRATKYGKHVHWDLWGPVTTKSLNGHFYVVARIDDATRETKLYFQEKKSQMFKSYKRDEALIETQTDNRIKTVCSNRGGEFQSTQMINHQDQRGTIRELMVHNSPPQNGVAECGMRTRAERARALLIASGLPQFLWEEAMKHATWLQNCSPASALDGKTP